MRTRVQGWCDPHHGWGLGVGLEPTLARAAATQALAGVGADALLVGLYEVAVEDLRMRGTQRKRHRRRHQAGAPATARGPQHPPGSIHTIRGH